MPPPAQCVQCGSASTPGRNSSYDSSGGTGSRGLRIFGCQDGSSSRTRTSLSERDGLLSAMRVHLLAVQCVAFLFERNQRPELVRRDLIEADPDPQLQRRPKVERAAQQQSRLGGLRGIQFVQRAVAAAAAIVGRIGTEAGIAEFVAAERPVNQEPEGGLFGPLPGRQFGSLVSWNAPSRASIAALTATAWWMMGTSPAYPSEDSSSFLKSAPAGARLMINSCRL